jgi:penicillin-binding protein 1A
VPGSGGKEVFPVSNYEDSYLGSASLWSATAASDNSVFAELGLKIGTKRIARLARRMGIRTQVSTNPAMTLGGLKEGVTPLEMAYAYSTIANHGYRAQSTFLPGVLGPIGFSEVKGHGIDDDHNKPQPVEVLPRKVADLEKEMLRLVVTSGTGKAAQVGDEDIWGKTGTTENYGDAWFVGGNDDMTVAVWVGYADKVQSMETEHAGSPVAGGTFPAEIFHDFMTAWVTMRDARRAARHTDDDDSTETSPVTPTQTVDPNAVPEGDQPAETTPRDQGDGGTEQDQPEAAPDTGAPDQTPAPETPAPETPAPDPTQPPTGGGGTGGGVTPNTSP